MYLIKARMLSGFPLFFVCLYFSLILFYRFETFTNDSITLFFCLLVYRGSGSSE